MGHGFTCEDGWKEIIWELLSEIESLSLEAFCAEPLQVEQVKEKFGELRVYTNWSTPAIEAAIEAAQERSRRTCELCGQPGTRFVSGGWWATRCVNCMPEEVKEGGAQGKPGKVAVFWLFRSRLVIHPTDLETAEPWGEYLNAPSHEEVWARYQRERPAAAKVEYDSPPRGRVVFDTVRRTFALYADTCILDIPELVAEVLRRLNLPPDTQVSPDDHYRCDQCKRRTG